MSRLGDLAVPHEPERLLMEKLRVAVETRISRMLATELELRRFEDYMVDAMVVQLRAKVLGHRLVQSEMEETLRLLITYPATWWDSWKRDVLPRLGRWGRWYLRRHPVREAAAVERQSIRVHFEEWATFPETTLAFPKELGHVHVMQSAYIETGSDRYRTVAEERTIANEQALAEAAIGALAAIASHNASIFEALRHGADGDDEVHRELMQRIDTANRARRSDRG